MRAVLATIRANVNDRTFLRCNSKPLQRAIGQEIANDLTRDLLRRGHCTDLLRSRSWLIFPHQVFCISILCRATHETGPVPKMIQSDERDDDAVSRQRDD